VQERIEGIVAAVKTVSLPDIEIIIVDDFSSDGSLAILRERVSPKSTKYNSSEDRSSDLNLRSKEKFLAPTVAAVCGDLPGSLRASQG
jgi:glycosyltransferase involved in cell wall biosynthesis